jgi:hypothetical protein
MFMDWRNNKCKMFTLFKAVCRFNTSPIKIPMQFFTEIEKALKIHMGVQRILNIQNNFEQEEQSRTHHKILFQDVL